MARMKPTITLLGPSRTKTDGISFEAASDRYPSSPEFEDERDCLHDLGSLARHDFYIVLPRRTCSGTPAEFAPYLFPSTANFHDRYHFGWQDRFTGYKLPGLVLGNCLPCSAANQSEFLLLICPPDRPRHGPRPSVPSRMDILHIH